MSWFQQPLKRPEGRGPARAGPQNDRQSDRPTSRSISSAARSCCRSSADVDHRPSRTQIVKELVAIIAPNPTILSQSFEKCFSAEGVKSGGCEKMGFTV